MVARSGFAMSKLMTNFAAHQLRCLLDLFDKTAPDREVRGCFSIEKHHFGTKSPFSSPYKYIYLIIKHLYIL